MFIIITTTVIKMYISKTINFTILRGNIRYTKNAFLDCRRHKFT